MRLRLPWRKNTPDPTLMSMLDFLSLFTDVHDNLRSVAHHLSCLSDEVFAGDVDPIQFAEALQALSASANQLSRASTFELVRSPDSTAALALWSKYLWKLSHLKVGTCCRCGVMTDERFYTNTEDEDGCQVAECAYCYGLYCTACSPLVPPCATRAAGREGDTT